VNGAVDAHPESRVQNSQPHGIGRVVTLDGLWAWNNLGRNVVFADRDFVPRAIFDESVFAEDEPSQYDLDVHAILDVPRAGIVVSLNHLGMVRAFSSEDVRRSGPQRRVGPVWTRTFAPDVERTVVVGDRLVGSRPREAGDPGLLVSEPLSRRESSEPLETAAHLELLGMVTALVAFRDGPSECIAIGSQGRVSVAPVTPEGVGPLRWMVEMDFEPRSLFWDGARVWAAGCERRTDGIDDYDWDALRGGGFAAFDPVDGRTVVRGHFAVDLAWGTGGIAVVHTGTALCGIGRRGEVCTFDARDGAPLATTDPISDSSIGIAHAAARDGQVLYGFNRGGYRLHAIQIPRTT
jgi:hypothetical protein